MTANQSARNVRLLIDGVNFTPCMISFEGSDNHIDQSGLMSFTGSIVLGNALGFTQSIDDRKNPTRFCRGNTITIDVTDKSGGLRRHPRGALRILTASYDTETQRQTLEVGDLIALLNFKEPTDPDVAGAKSSEGVSLVNVAENLLQAAGITNYSLSLPDYSYYYPLNLSGSYLQSLGKLLYAHNRVGWIDNAEIFQTEPVEIKSKQSLVRVTEGVNEIYYRRLAGAESPPSLIRAVGTEILSLIYSINTGSVSEQYGLLSFKETRTESYISAFGLKVRETRQTEWFPDDHIFQTTTTTEKPFGLIVPEIFWERTTQPLFQIFLDSIVIEKSFYEEEQCKLIRKRTEFYTEKSQYLAEIEEFDPSSFDIVADFLGLVLTKIIEERYIYDEKDRVSKITTLTQELAVIVLNGTDEGWDDWLGVPEYFVDSEYTEQQWQELSKDVWEYSTFTMQSQVRVSPDSIDPEEDLTVNQRVTQKLQVVLASAEKRVSSSGQEVPPAAERCPVTDNKLEENQVQGTAKFKDICENDYKPRERTYTVDYLVGRRIDVLPNIFTISSGGTPAQKQLEAIARTEGRLLWGRYKGQEIAAPIADSMLSSFKPLFGVHVTEFDGTSQNFVADGCSWVIGQEKALWACDGIWAGQSQSLIIIDENTVEPGVVIPFFTEPQDLTAGQGLGAFIFSYPYSLETIDLILSGGQGQGAFFTSGFTLQVGQGQGFEFSGQFLNLYWDEVEWDLTDDNIWNQLDSLPEWNGLDTANWDNVDWDNLIP